MSKTCKTCTYFKLHGCAANNPACKNWQLSMNAICKEATKSLEKAVAKHPDFCPFVIYKKNRIEALASLHEVEPDEPFFTLAGNIDINHLDRAREAVFQCPSVLNVLKCEVVEFCKELELGNFDRALEEAGDVIAVLYRALNGEGKEASHE